MRRDAKETKRQRNQKNPGFVFGNVSELQPIAARAALGLRATAAKILLRASAVPLITLIVLAAALPASAKPTQSEVFKSIQDNVNESDSSNVNLIPWICGGVGLILVLAWFGRRQTLQSTPKPLNNPNRLAKEILKVTSLKPKEFKQVKLLLEEAQVKDKNDMRNPLVLLLCPSLLAKAAAIRGTRADRRTIVQLIKKLESR